MNAFSDILVFIIKSLGSLYVSVVLLRFWLQMVRADFYNPASQAIVKLTNPLLIPIRRIIPSIKGVDTASLVLALIIQVILSEILVFAVYQQLINPIPSLVLFGLLGCLNLLLYIFQAGAIVIVIASWVAPYSSNPLLNLVRQMMHPLISPLQRIIPPIGGIDISIIFFFLGIGVFQKIMVICANAVGLVPTFVVGF